MWCHGRYIAQPRQAIPSCRRGPRPAIERSALTLGVARDRRAAGVCSGRPPACLPLVRVHRLRARGAREGPAPLVRLDLVAAADDVRPIGPFRLRALKAGEGVIRGRRLRDMTFTLLLADRVRPQTVGLPVVAPVDLPRSVIRAHGAVDCDLALAAATAVG